jgi:uracil-DNA glycosylase family 4
MAQVKDIPGCSGCPMRQKFPNESFVPSKKGSSLRLAILEAPGADEAIALEPAVGGAGRVLDMLYRKAGISRDSISIANTLCCRPPNNVYPTDSLARNYISKQEAEAAVSQCYRNHLLPVLQSKPWTRIDLLGDKALRVVSGKTEGIEFWRGAAINALDIPKPICVPTYHPAFVMRNQILSKVVIADLTKNTTRAPEYYNLHPSIDDVEAFVDKYDTFSYDIENDRHTLEISVVGLAGTPYHAMCVPFRGAYIPQLKRLFAKAKNVIGQNSLQHDEPILALHGVHTSAEATHWDIMLMQHLLMPDMEHGLGFIGSILVNKNPWKHQHGEDEALYNCRDTDVQFQAWQQLLPMLRKEQLEQLYLRVQVPLARICYLMRREGIATDPERLREVATKLQGELQAAEVLLPPELRSRTVTARRRVPAPPGTLGKSKKPVKFIMEEYETREFPWHSNDNIAGWLYDTLQLPKQLHVKSKEVTTDKTALDKLLRISRKPDRALRDHWLSIGVEPESVPVQLSTLKEMKKKDKLINGFLKEKQGRAKGRVHPSFNVHGTATGRLSSSDPNLQNQPDAARYIYVPSHPDWEFMGVDYSQIESRLCAFFADDQSRLNRYFSIPNFSEHKYAASLFLGVSYNEVEKDNDPESAYMKAKHIVHGADGGCGARRIANMYDLNEGEIKNMLTRWKNEIAKTVAWQVRVGNEAKLKGVNINPFGRKRWYWTDSAYTEGIRTIPQGTAADIIYRAMIGLYYDRVGLSREQAQQITPIVGPLPRPARMVLQVHDSILTEYPKDMREEVGHVIKTVFEQPWPELGGFSIPIAMGVSDSSWQELEDFELAE